ncbi:MAG TPA: CCA tRNA nucleotidyltransferase [Bryobacteraceae bacterium]|nr:CCA tRNA nucleotidyltransferase [Bryobacteraceae bacterium]
MSSEQLARSIAITLRKHGHSAYLVGGCVRDLLLGFAPKDYDVATSALPEQVLELWPQAQRVGAHFGVVLVTDDDVKVEVATYRTDHEYVDGRRPSGVTFECDARQDVVRRDFTINGLLLDPEANDVVDYVGGREDLRLERVRAIGEPEKRFREDHLRLLRAVRLAARLGFDIESETEAAIVRLHPLIRDVAAERVRDELVRILTEGNARRGFELLDRTGLLQEILPEVTAMKGVEQPAEFHPEGDVWVHTLLMLEALPAGVSPTLALGVLLHDVGKPPTFEAGPDRIRFDGHVEEGVRIARDILNRLRFSHDEARQVEALIENHMRFKDAPRMKESTLKRFMRLDRFGEHLELHRLDCMSSHGLLDNYEYVRTRREEFGEEQIRPARLVSGDDLIGLGIEPGPELGRLLRAIEDAQLEGRVRDRGEALALARELTTRPASGPAST